VIKNPAIAALPALVIHADWGLDPKKRWMATGVLNGGSYYANPPELVGELDDFLHRMHEKVNREDCILLGVDFPLGLPDAYAQKVGIHDFLHSLPRFGHGTWGAFYQVAETVDQISLFRPFYPFRPGGTSRQHLLDKLGISTIDHLLRKCEDAPPLQRRAAPLFWTLGAQQVGKAALNGWRNVIVPGLLDRSLDVVVWPFSGSLQDLIAPGRIIIAETYPTEFYRQLHLIREKERFSKRKQSARIMMGTRLAERAKDAGIKLHPELISTLVGGFGPEKSAEDPFDALVGLIGMLSLLTGSLPQFEPEDKIIKQVEGWIMGLNP
jgi:hypothetical protein